MIVLCAGWVPVGVQRVAARALLVRHVLLVLLSLVAAYVLWNRGVAHLGAARTVVYNTIVPLVATAIAMVGLHERPGAIHIAGGALIVAGVLVTGRSPAPEG